jgi:hypothetical protein
MYLQRPGEQSGRGRFWLALSLSTVTAAAVAAPLALKAVSVESERNTPAYIPAAPTGEQAPGYPSTSLPGITAEDGRNMLGNIGPAPDESTTTTEAPPRASIHRSIPLRPPTTIETPSSEMPTTIDGMTTTSIGDPSNTTTSSIGTTTTIGGSTTSSVGSSTTTSSTTTTVGTGSSTTTGATGSTLVGATSD